MTPRAPAFDPRKEPPEERFTDELRRVDPAFRQTIREYNVQMRIVMVHMGSQQIEDMRRAIVLLADAVENIPHAESVDLQAAGTRIRMARHEPFIAAQLHMNAAQEHQRALSAVADVLNDVAFGPYEAASAVGTQVRAFQTAVDRLGDPLEGQSSEEKVLAALVEAKRTLRKILEAAAAMEQPT